MSSKTFLRGLFGKPEVEVTLKWHTFKYLKKCYAGRLYQLVVEKMQIGLVNKSLKHFRPAWWPLWKVASDNESGKEGFDAV